MLVTPVYEDDGREHVVDIGEVDAREHLGERGDEGCRIADRRRAGR